MSCTHSLSYNDACEECLKEARATISSMDYLKDQAALAPHLKKNFSLFIGMIQNSKDHAEAITMAINASMWLEDQR